MRAEERTRLRRSSRLTWLPLSATAAVLVIPSYLDVYRLLARRTRRAGVS